MGLIAHYRLDGNADDVFGKFNGVASNVTWAAGKLGQAGVFSTNTQVITVPDGSGKICQSLNNSFSFAFWYLADPLSNLTRGLISYRNANELNRLLHIVVRPNGTLSFAFYSNDLNTNHVVSVGEWMHVACVGDRTKNTQTIYVNGVAIAGRVARGWLNLQPSDLFISNYSGQANSQAGGLLDDVRIYDHALSLREIRDLAQGLAVHYPMLDFQEPTENLLSVRLDTAPDLYGKSTKTYLGNGEYRFVNNGTGNSNIRLRCPLDRLVNGATYACQVKFKDNTGYVGIDWCDVGIAGLPSSSAAEGVLYGTAAKATYDATYNFLDITIGSGTSVTLYEAQVEHKPHVTPYTDSIRSARVVDTSGQGADAPLALATAPKWIEESPTGRGSYLFTNDATKRIDRELIDLGSTLTYSCWAKQDSTEGHAYKFIVSSGRDYDKYGVSISTVSGDIQARYGGGAQGNGVLSAGISLVGVWRHIVFTHDMVNGARLYVDGVLTATGPARTIDYSQANNRTVIGKMSYSYTSTTTYFPFSGPISDVRIYATALAADQVKELYQQRASLDSQGNFYAQLINEKGATKFQVTKAGQLSSQVSEVGITNGLIAYYPLNKDAKDYSGNGLHGVVTGATVVGGGFDGKGAYTFDGVDDYIRATGTGINAGSWAYPEATFLFWIRPKQPLSASDQNLVTVENTFEIAINNSGPSSTLKYASAPWAWRTAPGSPVVTGEWTMIAYTHSTTSRKLFVNGVEVYVSAETGGLAAGTPMYPHMTIGGRYSGPSAPYIGDLSALKIFNRALTAQEIAVEYKRTGPTKMTQHQGVTYIQGEFKEV